MNAVQLLGNLGRDPIIRATRTGRAVASFSIAVSRIYTTPQGEQRAYGLDKYRGMGAAGGSREE